MSTALQKRDFYSYIMMIGHLCADLCFFALTAMTPFLVVQKGMSYTAIAGMGFAMSLCNAIIQPVLGMMADKKDRPWLMAVGVFMAGLGIGLIGFLDNYYAILIAITISSIGSAIYHPDGGRMANYIAGASKGKGMSNFSFGGNLSGFVGPVVIVFAISHFGMRGTAILLIPNTIMAIWLLMLNSKFLEFAEDGHRETARAVAQGQNDDWNGFMRLSVVTVVRSAIMSGMMAFIPLFWLTVLNQSEEVSGLITSVIAISGAAATLIGGRLADRMGYRSVIRAGLLALIPCMIILAATRSLVVSAIMLVPAALALNLSYSPAVVLGQKLLPNHIGLASGITMGLASSIGGVISPILGRVGDTSGVEPVMWIVAGICVLAGVLSLILPEDPTLGSQNKEATKKALKQAEK